MEKVEYSDFTEIIKYGIECPECGDFIELDERPDQGETIFCEGCETELEVV